MTCGSIESRSFQEDCNGNVKYSHVLLLMAAILCVTVSKVVN